MLLVVELRHRVVRLGFEARPDDATLRGGGQDRQAGAREQIVDERGQEHRLAGAREPSHAQAQGAAGKVVANRAGDEPRLEKKIAEARQEPIRPRTGEPI